MRRALFLSEITGLLYFIYENMIILTPLKTLHFCSFSTLQYFLLN